MANSKWPAVSSSLPLIDAVQPVITQALLTSNKPNPTLLVGYSGGLDSTVLLHLLAHLALAQPPSFTLQALHVHHGLSSKADEWEQHCHATCHDLQIKLHVFHVHVDDHDGKGIEAAARLARYRAFDQISCDWICLAHHQGDQAETLLLQLARGSGVNGLSGMPMIDIRRKLIRPMLSVDRRVIEQYAKQHDLRWVEDESNQDTRYDRNYMRQVLMPVFSERYPAIQKVLCRVGQHMAEASELTEELAKIDAKEVLEEDRPGFPQKLNLHAMRDLSMARGKNILRWWYRWLINDESNSRIQDVRQMPSTETLLEIYHQLMHARADANLQVCLTHDWSIRRFQEYAYLVYQNQVNVLPWTIEWQGEPEIILPSGRLLIKRAMGQGLSLAKLKQSPLIITSRKEAVRLKPSLNRPSKSLKQLFQEHAIPPWRRQTWPLLMSRDQVISIAGLCSAYEYLASFDEEGLLIIFEPEYPALVWRNE